MNNEAQIIDLEQSFKEEIQTLKAELDRNIAREQKWRDEAEREIKELKNKLQQRQNVIQTKQKLICELNIKLQKSAKQEKLSIERAVQSRCAVIEKKSQDKLKEEINIIELKYAKLHMIEVQKTQKILQDSKNVLHETKLMYEQRSKVEKEKNSNVLEQLKRRSLLVTKELELATNERIKYQKITNAFRIKAIDAFKSLNIVDNCCVCLEAKIEIILIPCYHAALCLNCSSQITTCPICRQSIRDKKKFFYSSFKY